MGCVRECRASAVGGKKDDGDERRVGRENGLGIVTPYLVKLIANNDLHDFRWDIVLKLL
jgi:hypothetical protein